MARRKKRSWEEEVTLDWNEDKKKPSFFEKIKPNLIPIVSIGVSTIFLAGFVAYISLNEPQKTKRTTRVDPFKNIGKPKHLLSP